MNLFVQSCINPLTNSFFFDADFFSKVVKKSMSLNVPNWIGRQKDGLALSVMSNVFGNDLNNILGSHRIKSNIGFNSLVR